MRTWVIPMLLAIGACQPAPVGVQNVELQRNSAGQCAAQCNQIGLALDAVVVMANNVGCVCRATPPPGAATATSATGGSSAGGLTAVLLQVEAARQVAAQQQQQRNAARR